MTGKLKWEILERYNDVTREVGQEAGVPVIDMAILLPKNTTFFYDYIHYTKQGADAVAQILHQQLCPILQT